MSNHPTRDTQPSGQPDSSPSSVRSSRGKRGLAPEWFLDKNCFEFEQKHLFQNSWTPIGYRSSFDRPGQFVRLQVNGTECVAVMDEADQVRVFQNVCRHRGTQLCFEPRGQLKSSLTCPYHGWKYDFQGNLTAAPHMQNVVGFCPEEYGLVEYEVKDWQGLLFATADPTQDLPIAKLTEVAGLYELEKFSLIETLTYDVPANWKLFFQNFNECYHCPSVHPQLTPYSDYRNSENEFESGDVLGGPMQIRDSAATISIGGQLSGPIPRNLPLSEHKKARYFTVFPNLFISFFPDYVMVHRIEPIAFDRTRLVCDFLFHPETAGDKKFNATVVTEFWDLTNRQDWEMCKRVQVGMTTPGFRPSPYSNLESLLVAFEEHYTRSLGERGFAFANDH